MKYTCPVCGNNQLNRPPADYTICPCCRTEFGASDCAWTHEELREDWIRRGAKWGGRHTKAPSFWSPIQQLRNIGYEVTDEEKRLITPTEEIQKDEIDLPISAPNNTQHPDTVIFVANFRAKIEAILSGSSLSDNQRQYAIM
jgi:hypothetical protein